MANGNFAGGDGTESNPYLIEDADDLSAIRNDLSGHYELINDIDLGVAPYNEGEGWQPIGGFSGVLDGGGHEIINLYINSGGDYTGLFGGSSSGMVDATVRNLGITNASIRTSGIWDHGVLSGRVAGDTLVENCYSTGEINTTGGQYARASGLVGALNGSSLTLQNCYSTCSVHSGYVRAGLIAANWGGVVNITNSYYAGSLNPSGAGDSDNIITGGVNKASVTSTFWDKDVSLKKTSDHGVGLTTPQMKTAQSFVDAGWNEVLNEGGSPVWILKDGEYPKLNFKTILTKHIIKSQDKMQSLSETGEWIDLGITGTPTALQFEELGMDDISNIPKEKWDELARPVEILTWTDNVDAIGADVAHQKFQYIPPKLELTVPEYTLADYLERPLKLLTYTDGEQVPEIKTEYNLKGIGTRIMKRGE